MTDWGTCQSAPGTVHQDAPKPAEDWGDAPTPYRVWRAANGFLATSRLYPLLVSDSLGTAFRLPSRLSTFRQPIDPLGTTFRLPASGNLQQTYFPNNVDVRETQSLGTTFRLPLRGNLGTTYFPRYVDVRETQHLGTAFRLPSSGNLRPGILVPLDGDDLNTTFRLPSSGDLS
jgi:hypothetical protein